MSRADADRAVGGGIERTFAFVDLAGFTALTEAHGDEHAADLVERFTGMARAALGPDDRLVKSIGDAHVPTSGEDKPPLSSTASLGRLWTMVPSSGCAALSTPMAVRSC